ncbi:MAG TPA: multiheme c-type cytochrome, partial [Vicinamibacteria bacterium]|nr:multiheme c-type cytochrome [Vicinamibacteria bacterium]
MSASTAKPGPTAARDEQWSRRFGAMTLAWLAFETLSGLAVYLLPFSVPNQWLVLLHTGVGLVLLLPACLYQWQHLAEYWPRPRTPLKVLGYLAGGAVLAACVSGVVVTVQAWRGPRLSYGWDRAHILATFALIAFTAPHVLVTLVRDRAAAIRHGLVELQAAIRRTALRTGAVATVLAATVAGAWLWYPGDTLANRFPLDYSFKYGPERPFAPSLATTASGGAYDPRSLSGSRSCGTAGCHEQIAQEWSVSAHRWAAMDPAFQRIQEEMGKQNGAESTRYCGGCHDPISLFSGTKNIFTADLTNLVGYDEGVSCLACHSIRKTDVRGNANFVVAQPERYLFELREGEAARLLRDFLIRAYPRQHMADLSKRLFKTPEYCAACHKQFIDQEVNNVGWVQLQ